MNANHIITHISANMKRRLTLSLATAAVMMTVLLAACRSHTAAPAASPQAAAAAAGDSWHDLRIPLKISIDSPASISASGRATMVRDSLVDISLRVFGFEVAMAHITADSVYLIDKYHKQYFAESLGTVMGSHPITVGQLQNMLLGRVKSDRLTFTNPRAKGDVTVDFSDYAFTTRGPIATQVSLNVPLEKLDISALLEWNASSARWDTYQRTTFTRPGGKYRRVSTASIKDMLKGI